MESMAKKSLPITIPTNPRYFTKNDSDDDTNNNSNYDEMNQKKYDNFGEIDVNSKCFPSLDIKKTTLCLYKSFNGYEKDPILDGTITENTFCSKLFEYCGKEKLRDRQIIISTDNKLTLKESDRMNVCKYKANVSDEQTDANIKEFINDLGNIIFRKAIDGDIYSIVAKLWKSSYNQQIFYVNIHSIKRLDGELNELDIVKNRGDSFVHDNKSPYDKSSPYRGKEIATPTSHQLNNQIEETIRNFRNNNHTKTQYKGKTDHGTSRVVNYRTNDNKNRFGHTVNKDNSDNNTEEVYKIQTERKYKLLKELINNIKNNISLDQVHEKSCLEIVGLLDNIELKRFNIIKDDFPSTKIKKMIDYIKNLLSKQKKDNIETAVVEKRFSPEECRDPLKKLAQGSKDLVLILKSFISSANKLISFKNISKSEKILEKKLKREIIYLKKSLMLLNGESFPENMNIDENNTDKIKKIELLIKEKTSEYDKLTQLKARNIKLLSGMIFEIKLANNYIKNKMYDNLILGTVSYLNKASFHESREFDYQPFINLLCLVFDKCTRRLPDFVTIFIERYLLMVKNNNLKETTTVINMSFCLAPIIINNFDILMNRSKFYLNNIGETGNCKTDNMIASFKRFYPQNIALVLCKYIKTGIIIKYEDIVTYLISLNTDLSLKCALIWLVEEDFKHKVVKFRTKLSPNLMELTKNTFTNYKGDNERMKYIINMLSKHFK